ncbi:MAG: anti-sigma factor family protein [Mesorhizobium sp.]
MSGRDFTERDIHMALDGELPGEDRAGYEAWLAANPDMQARRTRYAGDADALRSAFAGVLDEPVPARLTRAALGEKPVVVERRRPRWWLAAAAALLLAVGGAGGYVAASLGGGSHDDSAQDQLAEEAIAAHVVYAAEKRHAVEVPASDLDHMETWLSNRIGMKLVAPNLSDDGFQLVGGRLLPAGGHRAAMLLYEDAEGNRISLFVTTEPAAHGKGIYAQSGEGPRAVYWLDKGYGCAVVGSLPDNRLSEVAKRAYEQLVAGMIS